MILHTEMHIKRMLEFLIDNIYTVVLKSGLSTIPMGTNCAPLLANLVCIHMKQNLFNNLYVINRSIALAFSSTFRYINHVLSILTIGTSRLASTRYIPVNFKKKKITHSLRHLFHFWIFYWKGHWWYLTIDLTSIFL